MFIIEGEKKRGSEKRVKLSRKERFFYFSSFVGANMKKLIDVLKKGKFLWDFLLRAHRWKSAS